MTNRIDYGNRAAFYKRRYLEKTLKGGSINLNNKQQKERAGVHAYKTEFPKLVH